MLPDDRAMIDQPRGNGGDAAAPAYAVAARDEPWQSENRAVIESSNLFVARHGLPLAGYRQF
ncbi:hypothetical protein IP88_13815 [alpha proteobacterium AAP81b]|nr:hypothetical protein IP88_13815 [alpha proteobacterium AAP81b]